MDPLHAFSQCRIEELFRHQHRAQQIVCALPVGMAADATELLQAQLEELMAVRACFPDEISFAPIEADNLHFAELVAAGQSSAATAADVPALSGTLRLPGIELAGAPVHLAFVLSKRQQAPGLQVQTNTTR